jgi:hypothetical protein
MRVLFRGTVTIFGEPVYIESDEDECGTDRGAAFAGQEVGLCGAMMEGVVYVDAGGGDEVALTLTLYAEEPEVGECHREWEEIVEVSFRPDSPDSRLLAYDGEFVCGFGLPEADYRVRYCARGLDLPYEDEAAGAELLLELWPCAPRPAALVRQTSGYAARSHEYARSTRALPPRRPPVYVDPQVTRREAEERARRLDQLALDEERERWGGRLPSERLRGLRGGLTGLAARDLELAEAVVAADPGTQREIVRWTVHRAYEQARLAEWDWVAPGLEAFDRGEPLPPPFDDLRGLHELLTADTVQWEEFGFPPARKRVMSSVMGMSVADRDEMRSRRALSTKREHAVGVLVRAALVIGRPDAALGVLDNAMDVFTPDDHTFLDELRSLLNPSR